MPFLPDEQSTDKLLKNLGIDLSEQFVPAELRNMEWYQYRDFDHAQTQVATVMAADAFFYLAFDARGSWRKTPKLIAAIIAFMGRYYAAGPQVRDLARLKSLVDAQPPDREAIFRWFSSIYPPSS